MDKDIYTYRFEIDKGHFIVTDCDGRKMLLDTGSPVSFGSEESNIVFGGKEYRLRGNGSLIGDINGSNLIETDVDVIIGLDVITEHSLTFDNATNELIIDCCEDAEGGECIGLVHRSVMGQGFLLVETSVNGAGCNTLVDTGAWISYLSSGFLRGVEIHGWIDDYNPIIGDIHTSGHYVDVKIGGIAQPLHVAKMPGLLEMTLKMIGVDMVMGLSCLKCDRLCLDVPNDVMRVW